ncbi:LPS export ABC transporter periplasmic protein LptC [Rivibacter subsaxonicus]|uniref:Lipopolysaccharide export system protein LptC n=1 Tax=Rivibacter subsaxonicus TaxID=457575 RepID=A0A4Q7VW15_9BURK|nr:LPS export ABC transporter periplasmic protein LptC [Rivibacter subsaxonicus]RZU00884.1 lipopolysaccharide export system protein LptC [Rivibacter subsaxonicus]
MGVAADEAEAPFADLTPLAPLAVRGTPARAEHGPWTRHLWDRLLNAVPVLLMALLAAVTWWLVKNTPVPGEARPKAPPQHVPDAVMHGFSLNSHDREGELLTRLDGDAARHFPDTDTYEIDGPRVRRVDAQGRVLVASARSGLSNGDGSQVRLSGDARVLREAVGADRLEFRGEQLEFFTRTEQLHSSRPVQVLSGRGELQAGSLDYDHLQRVAQFGGRVSGVFRPPGTKAAEPTDGEGAQASGKKK